MSETTPGETPVERRLREMAEWEAKNPPESGVVKVTRDTHAAFWRWVETRRAS